MLEAGGFGGLAHFAEADLFFFFMNGANTLLQGILHLLFVQYFTGAKGTGDAGGFSKAGLSVFKSRADRAEYKRNGSEHLKKAGLFPARKLRLWHYGAYLLLLALTGLAADLVFSFAAGTGESAGFSDTRATFLLSMVPLAAAGANFAGLFGICRFAIGCSPSDALLAAVLTYYIPQFSFGFVNSAEALALPFLSQEGVPFFFLALALAAALMLCGGCYLLILKSFPLKERFSAPHTWMLLPPCLFLLAAEFYLAHISYSQTTLPMLPETGKHLALLGLDLLSLAALFSILYGYRRTCRGLQAQAAMASLAQQIRAQKTYTQEARMRYEKTRAFRHDLQNHLSVLGGLLKSGSVSQARLYLEKLHAVSGDLSFPWKTGSPVVDILLEEKLSLAQSRGIKAEADLTLPGEGFIDDLDLCVIFSNALDNGIQACTEALSSEPSAFIRITGQSQGDFYMLEFENTCLPGLLPKAGTGLSNIQTAAGKYGGGIHIERSGGLFQLSVLLNISVHPEDISGGRG